ncbi:multidrug effflux MFS transporter [Undibacterium sp. SXout7W]|uniref:multidrug effflux MFS transporter n=1 Tax=Undibacterium sp. SXout7W TaxID=3413049 RepID=UPI003BF09F2F
MKSGSQSALSVSILLMLLLATQPVATDVYLPALPQIAIDTGGTTGQVQWTLTAYIMSFGLMQLVAGSLADKYGRRSTLLWGLALYVAAGMVGVLAMHLPLLIASRVVQGAATAACIISARAVIRDKYSGAAGLGIMARSMTGMSLIGFLSPVVGGLVTEYFSWHATLAVVTGFGVLTWLVVYFYFVETHTNHTAHTANTTHAPANDGVVITTGDTNFSFSYFLRNKQFLFSSLLAGSSFSGAMAFLMLSPFVFIGEFGMSRVAYGVLPALCSMAFLIGTVICRQCLRYWTVPKVVRVGASLSLIGGITEFVLWQLHVRSVFAIVAPQCIFMLGHGFHQPCGQGGAVAPFPDCAGRAAAVSGFLITGTAFTVGQIISHSSHAASQTLVMTMLVVATALGVLGWIAIPSAYRDIA